jgi:glycosyltransferase involved in cell wall biosynthesis
MLVSIIIPCYNVEAFLQECLDSAIAQTHHEIEIIAVNNNSTDGTAAILERNQLARPELIKVFSEMKKGACAARNTGLRNSSGDWIQFLDGDDLLLPGKIASQLEAAKGNEDAVLIAGAYHSRDISGEEKLILPVCEDPLKAIFTTNFGITSANLFRSEAVRAAGGWTETLGSSQEADLMFRMVLKKNRTLCDRNPLTVVRARAEGQISQMDPARKWRQYVELRIKMQEQISSMPEEDKAFYSGFIFNSLRTLARYDLNGASEIFDRHFGKSYMREGKGLYSLMLRLLGFRLTERLAGIIK